MLYSVRNSAAILALVASLALAPVAPEAGNVIFLTIGALSIALMFRQAAQQFRRPIAWMPLLALVLIALSYAIGSKSLNGLVGLAYFSPMFAVWPLLTAADDMKHTDHAGLIGVLALGGAAAAAVVAILEVQATGTNRAGEGVANPIHFADVTLLVGFLACAGLFARTGRWRVLFVIGPALAMIAVVLSGTRGAVVAGAAMLAVAGVMTVALRLVSMRTALVAVAVLIVAGVLAAVLGASQLSGIQRVLIDMADVFSTGLPTDESTNIRLRMMQGGWQAFLQSPIFGHGPLAFVGVAEQILGMSPDTWPHLHNDLVDFAASAGVLGLVAYALFLAAPIAEVLKLPSGVERSRILVLVSTLVTGFFVMGLTNAMFGILTVTTTYAAICVVTGILVAQAKAAAAA